jgi:uncharacterized protein (DUF58 family)
VKLIWRLWYWGYLLSSGWQYWAHRRFTPAGIGVGIGLLAACLMGPDTENNVAYQAVSLLFIFLLLALLSTLSFRARFHATRILPRFGTVGTPLHYQVVLRNLTKKPQAGLTLLENVADPRPRFAEWLRVKLAEEKHFRSFRFMRGRVRTSFRSANLREAEVPNLPPGQEAEVPITVMPLTRGTLQFSGVTIARPDPLGLFRSFVRHSVAQSVLILPRRYPLPHINLPGAFRHQAGGVALASNVGQSEEFVALRDYRHGDPLRHIHWRSWARVGKPVVREFEDEFFVRHALVLDTAVDNPHSSVFEDAVSVAASFAASIRTQESLLDLLFVGAQSYCFTAGRGLAHSDQMLEILASVRPSPDPSLTALETLVLNHISAVSGAIFVFLRWDKPRQDFVAKIRALGVPLLVLVVTSAAYSSAITPGVMEDDPQQFHVLEAGNLEAGLAKLG